MPALRQALASSSSQSPPLGRPTIDNRPRQGPGIQNRSAFIILLLYYLPGEAVDILATFHQDR